MRRVLLVSVLLAAGASGCGGSGNDLIPERTAARMVEQVDKLEVAMSRNPPKCDDARDAAQAGRRRAAGLSSKVDEELKQNLIDWFEHLEDEARRECNRRQEPEETPTPEPTEEPEPEETPTETPTPEPTPAETPDPTPTAEPTPGPDAEPPATGGVDGDAG